MKAETQPRSNASVCTAYIVLAAVNLATIAFTLAWSSHTSRDYHVALQENRRSSERLGRLIELRTVAARVSAATLNVFLNADPEKQRRKRDDAVAEFETALVRATEAGALGAEADASELENLYLQSAMRELVEVSDAVLSVAADDHAATRTNLPRMDSALRSIMNRVSRNAERVRTGQVAAFERQNATYDAMVRRNSILSLLVVVFVVGVTVYGVGVVRDLGTAREREEYIEALQQREATLQAAIAERDEQQELAREREELLLSAEELGTIGNYSWNVANDQVYWSDELCRIFGVPLGTSDANYAKYMNGVHPDDREYVVGCVHHALANAGPFTFEHRWVRPNGEICRLHVKGKIETDADGRATRMIGLIQDVTEKRATSARLSRREEQLAEAQRIARLGSWDWTAVNDESTWSDELFRIIGVDKDSVSPSFETYNSFLHPDDRQRLAEQHSRDVAERVRHYTNEHRLIRPDGSVVHVVMEGDVHHDADGERTSIVGTVQDITERKRIEENLRISEERFAFAAMATNEIIWDYDPATQMFWCNETFTARYGFAESTTGALTPEAWLANLDPDDRERVAQSFYDAITNGEQFWTCEYRARYHDGEYHHILDRGYLLSNDAGKVVRVIGASQDIHERKRATEELAQLHQQNKHVLDSTADAIFGVDRAGLFNLVNAAGARMFGRTAEEMIGQNAHALLHHSRPDGSAYPVGECPIEASITQGVRGRVSETFWRKDGTSVPVEVSTNPMLDSDGTIIGSVVTCTDITERLRVDRMKDEFVSTVSHELRTPLTAIRGSLGLLASGRVGAFAEKAQRLLDIASSNTDRLVRLINDILDLEKIDAGKLTLSPRPVAVDDVIRQAVDSVRLLLDRAHITAVVEAPPDVISLDADRIIQTLTNLLGNAIKFSPPESTIRVSAKREGSMMVFRVTDEGRGIPAEKLESIFERFEQVDASDSRDKGGSGLGLAICRSIVRQHGGTIHAESEPGRSSTFVFAIPAPAADPAVQVRAQRTVLLCDGDASARATMRVMLEQSDFAVREVERAEDLREAMAHEAPNVVLLDLETEGRELLGQLKANPATAGVPVVITSLRRPEDLALLEGSCTWLPKPLSEETLVEALKCACDSRSRPRLLLVEDDLDLARVIAALFERYDIEITHAATGSEAIEIARRTRPDLLILDLVLPDVDGFAIVSALRTDDRCRNVSLLVYSALEPSPEQRERLRLGRTEFLTKSRVTPEELERRVASLLSSMTDRESGGISDAA